MEITEEIIIESPIGLCWRVMGNQFTKVHLWSSTVYHATGDGKKGLNGAQCDIRGCEVQGLGNISEKLTRYDPVNHILSYEVISGLPRILKSARNTWKLLPIDTNTTKLQIQGELEVKGVLGHLIKPILRLQFGAISSKTVEDFKYYVEFRSPHPRKVRRSQNNHSPTA